MYRWASKLARFPDDRLSPEQRAASSVAANLAVNLAPSSGASAWAERPLTKAAVTAENLSVALGPSATAYSIGLLQEPVTYTTWDYSDK